MSPLPLHSMAADATFEHGGNAGLWFDKYFNAYPDDFRGNPDPTRQNEWLDWMTSRSLGDSLNLQATQRRMASLAKARHGDVRCFSTSWRMASGLGNPNPMGHGFLWHPTLGVPYLAGAGIKGMFRAWLECWADETYRLKIYEWMGTPERMGRVSFFDAIPVKPVLVVVDVLTPHYGDWLSGGARIDQVSLADQWRRIPADWHEPIPVKFLAVENATFQVGVAPVSKHDEVDIAEVLEQLGLAFELLGAGAKTAAGYGRLVLSSPGPAG